eukprot:7451692-Pyramimonas_sp.AAC.1
MSALCLHRGKQIPISVMVVMILASNVTGRLPPTPKSRIWDHLPPVEAPPCAGAGAHFQAFNRNPRPRLERTNHVKSG